MKKLKIMGCLVTAWFIFAVASARVPGVNYFKTKRINYVLHRQLPIGSTKAQAKSFLDKEEFEYSFNTESDGSAQAYAIIRGTSWGAMVSVDTQYIFTFNYRGKLDKISIEEFGTGP